MMKMISKWIKKKAALDRRYKQMDRLILSSEKAYKSKNKEQYEAYEECIRFQQQKIIETIKEIIKINYVIQKLEKEECHESNCSNDKERSKKL